MASVTCWIRTGRRPGSAACSPVRDTRPCRWTALPSGSRTTSVSACGRAAVPRRPARPSRSPTAVVTAVVGDLEAEVIQRRSARRELERVMPTPPPQAPAITPVRSARLGHQAHRVGVELLGRLDVGSPQGDVGEAGAATAWIPRWSSCQEPLRRARSPLVRRRRVRDPVFGPLRVVLMPRSWLEVSEFLARDPVQVAEELDHVPVGVGVVDEHVVPDTVTPGTPDQANAVRRERVAGAQQLRAVAELEGEVVQLAWAGTR